MSTAVTYEFGEAVQTETERVAYTIDLSPLTAAPTQTSHF
jgi:hypothetical protein